MIQDEKPPPLRPTIASDNPGRNRPPPKPKKKKKEPYKPHDPPIDGDVVDGHMKLCDDWFPCMEVDLDEMVANDRPPEIPARMFKGREPEG